MGSRANNLHVRLCKANWQLRAPKYTTAINIRCNQPCAENHSLKQIGLLAQFAYVDSKCQFYTQFFFPFSILQRLA